MAYACGAETCTCCADVSFQVLPLCAKLAAIHMCRLKDPAGHVDSWCEVQVHVSELSWSLRLSWVCTTITASSVFACWGNILVGDSSCFTGLVCRTLSLSGGSLTGYRLLGLSGVLGALLQCRHLVVSSHQPYRWLGGWNDVMM